LITIAINRSFIICWVLVLGAVFFAISPLEAQRGGGGRRGGGGGGGRSSGESRSGNTQRKEKNRDSAEMYFIRLYQVLQLNNEQENEAQKLFKAMGEEKKKIEKDTEVGAINVFEGEEKRKEIMEKFKEGFGALLNDVQKEKWKKLQKEKEFREIFQ
jgi:hypothetical protein